MEPNRDFIMPPSLQGLRQVDINPISLSFRDDLEKPFRETYFVNSQRTMRFSLMAGILMYGFFGILDAKLIPEMVVTLWIIRFAVVCPFMVGVILISYLPAFKTYFQPTMAATILVAGSGIIYMIAILPPPVNQTYYAGLILVLIWGYTFTRVRFTWATTAGWILVALYEFVVMAVIQSPGPVLMNNNFFFISSNLVGMGSCYFIEYYTRRDYVLAFMLDKEQEKVKSVNRRLEKIVAKRTAQLLEKNRELSEEIEERKRVEKGRAELESKLQEAQKMEALGRLAGGIAHDFNNLLMGIQGNTSLMLLKSKSTHPFYEKLKNTEQYVIRGSELTKQLLGFARGGKYQVNTTNLNTLISDSALLFGRTNKEISIQLQLASEPLVVKVDRGQIEQVLLNLIMNAWQAMPGGGEIKITTENATIDERKIKGSDAGPGTYVKTSVVDKGIGMDEKTMQKIFDPFFTTKEMGRGTGMGLASAYGIIQNHGGFFEVKSRVGEGTTISFYLPACNDTLVAEETHEPTELRTGNETILLVDDEEIIVDVASEILESLGYTVIVARSGQEAVAIYDREKGNIALVILDLIMPGLNGRKTYERLNQMAPEVKVLLSSGYSLSGEASGILEQGRVGFIQKPYNINDLSQKVREMIG